MLDNLEFIYYNSKASSREQAKQTACTECMTWDLSSAGRASALQAEGHRFEPCRSHFHKASNAGVAELADAQDLKSCGTYTPVPVRFRSPALLTL